MNEKQSKNDIHQWFDTRDSGCLLYTSLFLSVDRHRRGKAGGKVVLGMQYGRSAGGSGQRRHAARGSAEDAAFVHFPQSLSLIHIYLMIKSNIIL